MENSPSRCGDKEISHKMRFDNYEQFKTLCRMHLSFELDLNTDEFDLPCHEVVYLDEKGKLKKWNRLSKKIKSCTSAVKNSPTEQNHLHLTIDFINQLRQLKQFLLKEDNLCQEGIFRRTGAVSRQNELRSLINNHKQLDLNENYTVHDCATVFKSYLADLPEPLLTDAHYPAHCQISDLCNGLSKNSPDNKKDQHLLNSVQLLILLLPEQNRLLLEDIIEMLNKVSKLEKSNKMSPDTLATLFSPHLICPRNLPPEALHYVSQTMSNVISFMILKGLEIFEIPSKLAIDIRAYYHEIKRKKTMSPEQTLDESISDVSTVNTVYTFVDREKTAAASAHNTNPTDTALAQLYAHIQSMPESSKKRKLIKQFNKENGQGTPQLLMVNRVKNSEPIRSAKSISNSIKKHIFHKGIMSRTPKRSNTMANFSTPNGVPKTPKLRVLFQSPISILPSTNNNEPLSTLLGTPSSSITSTLKSHPLHKSISSSSLITATTTNTQKNTTNINDSQKVSANSAPVSRVCSSDLTSFLSNSVENSKSSKNQQKIVLSDITKQLLAKTENKIIGCNDNITTQESSNDNSIKSSITQNINDLKSKYKSEPDLSRIIKNCDSNSNNNNNDYYNFKPIKINGNENFTKKLIKKGVSMNNLRLPITAQESKTFKRALFLHQIASNPNSFNGDDTLDSMPSFTENLVLIDKKIDSDNIENLNTTTSTQNLNIYHRNIDLITSTPSIFLGRRSMSPITKSTQRMPKSMQESIMTPRSRKPVMLMATTLGSSEQNQTIYQSDLSNFNEQDEDSFIENDKSNNGNDIYIKNNTDNDIKVQILKNIANNSGTYEELLQLNSIPDSLTNTFREYLLSRSVLTASPVDSSFSSQPDDFCGSILDIHDINESQMSSSLLYCLDGNEPNQNVNKNNSLSSLSSNQTSTSSVSLINCDSNGVPTTNLTSIPLNNRKRSASYKTTKNNCNDVHVMNDENNLISHNISKTKKLLIVKENPGETSL